MHDAIGDSATAEGTTLVLDDGRDAEKLTAYIHTSDRMLFRRCRRQWAWMGRLSDTRYDSLGKAAPLWYGTGMHYALEDYHGYNIYGSPDQAFLAYCIACRITPNFELPMGWKEHVELGIGMMKYYTDDWMKHRDPLKTYWHNGEPQVEVRFEVEIPIESVLQYFGDRGIETRFDRAVYRGTIDRVIIDEHNRLWLLDYKSAKQFQHGHLEMDDQVTSYLWAGSVLYEQSITGFIYQQHKKTVPQGPRILASGKISSAASQKTTHRLYRKALINMYGEPNKAPADNIKCLTDLAASEDEEHDEYIRRDRVYRNRHQVEAQGSKILLELEDMMNDNLPLYPNPTRECSWCPVSAACISIDSGGDWELDLSSSVEPKQEDKDTWRPHLPQPDRLPELLNLVR